MGGEEKGRLIRICKVIELEIRTWFIEAREGTSCIGGLEFRADHLVSLSSVRVSARVESQIRLGHILRLKVNGDDVVVALSGSQEDTFEGQDDIVQSCIVGGGLKEMRRRV